MKWNRWGAALALAAAAGAVQADLVQVNLDVKFMVAPSDKLKDLGVDFGWGLGVSMDLPNPMGSNAQPFVKAEYQRQDGDDDLEIESYGVAGGIKLQLTPQVSAVNPVYLYLSVGAYETKARDALFSEKDNGIGFDVGVQTKVPLFGNIPTLSLLFTRRPKAFGEDTDNLVIMISPSLIKTP